MFLASRLLLATVRPVTDFAWAKAEQCFYLLLILLWRVLKIERFNLLRLLRRLVGTALLARPSEEVCIGVCLLFGLNDLSQRQLRIVDDVVVVSKRVTNSLF
jgi:hypothetical protein